VPAHVLMLETDDVTALVTSQPRHPRLARVELLPTDTQESHGAIRVPRRSKHRVELVLPACVGLPLSSFVATPRLRSKPHVFERSVAGATAGFASIIERGEVDEVHSTVALPGSGRALERRAKQLVALDVE